MWSYRKLPPSSESGLPPPQMILPAPSVVIPAKAGIQVPCCSTAGIFLDSRFRGNDARGELAPIREFIQNR